MNAPFVIPYPPIESAELAAAKRTIDQLCFALNDVLTAYVRADNSGLASDRARILLSLVAHEPINTATIAIHELTRLIEADIARQSCDCLKKAAAYSVEMLP
jgi:hypothetical protein